MTEFDTYSRRPGTPGISLRAVMGTSLLAFIGGAALIGWLVYDDKLPLSADFGKPAVTAPAPKASPLAGALPAPSASPSLAAAAGGMDQRIAALEQRLARLDLSLVGLTFVVAIIATVLAAFYPAWRAAHVQPAWQLKSS